MLRRSAVSLVLLAAPFGGCTFKTVTPINPAPEVVATENFEQVENNAVSILFVVDNSGSMAEEQFNMMANIARFVDIIEATGAEAKFAVVTTDVDLNPEGKFIGQQIGNNLFNQNLPVDTVNGAGQLIRDIPNNSGNGDIFDFCGQVVTLSQNGVLDPKEPNLKAFIDGFGEIPDFSGRETGTFQDGDGDKIADNKVVAAFEDAVSCMMSAGVRGSGSEVGLCTVNTALDTASLAGANNGFFTPDRLLATIFLTDEDDSTISINPSGNEFKCNSLVLDNQTGSLLGASSEANLCGTGANGQFNNLVSVETFADRLKTVQPDEKKLFVATIAGPPGVVQADCNANLPVPTCFNAISGQASPGNRYFEFTQFFLNKIDALQGEICSTQFGDVIADIANKLGALLNSGCLSNPIDAVNFDPIRDMRVIFDLSEAVGASVCDDIGNNVADTLPDGRCQIKSEFLDITAVSEDICAGGFQVAFPDFIVPTGAKVEIVYLAVPE